MAESARCRSGTPAAGRGSSSAARATCLRPQGGSEGWCQVGTLLLIPASAAPANNSVVQIISDQKERKREVEMTSEEGWTRTPGDVTEADLKFIALNSKLNMK